MIIKGKITHIDEELKTGDTKKGGRYAKISFVVQENGDFPNSVKLDYMKTDDDIKYIDGFIKHNKVGTSVEVEFNLKATEYKGNYYNNASAWKITTQKETESVASSSHSPVIPIDEDEQLPF